MRKRISRRHEAQVRVQRVCAEHSAFFDGTPGGQATRAILGTHGRCAATSTPSSPSAAP